MHKDKKCTATCKNGYLGSESDTEICRAPNFFPVKLAKQPVCSAIACAKPNPLPEGLGWDKLTDACGCPDKLEVKAAFPTQPKKYGCATHCLPGYKPVDSVGRVSSSVLVGGTSRLVLKEQTREEEDG